MKDASKIAGDMLRECESGVCDGIKAMIDALDTIDRLRRMSECPTIKQVIYNEPVTAIVWGDGDVTRTRCQDGDAYDRQTGFLFCLVKKAYPGWHDMLESHCWSGQA